MLIAQAVFPHGRGVVAFSQASIFDPVDVTIDIFNTTDGYHGIHIHEDALGEGPHFHIGTRWTPTSSELGTPHGDGMTDYCHTGDMCNNIQISNGSGHTAYRDKRISLYSGTINSVIGRSVVLHQGADDYGIYDTDSSKMSGNSGPHLATATIASGGIVA